MKRENKFRDFEHIRTENKLRKESSNTDHLTHAYAHRLADVHFAGFAPAFTLSLGDSDAPANRQCPKPWSLCLIVKHPIRNVQGHLQNNLS